jgi:hypothetical protein
MKIAQFEARPGEYILFRTLPRRRWYNIAWKIGSGLLGSAVLVIIIYGLLASSMESGLDTFLPAVAARILTDFVFLGILPLLGVAWVVEDVACAYIAEIILTDQRLWVRGSPYAWSLSDLPLEEIESMTWQRDAIFLRQKSNRKTHVHMFPEGKKLVQVYKERRGISV